MSYRELLERNSRYYKNNINETLSKLICAFNRENFEEFCDLMIDLNYDWKNLHNVLFELEFEEVKS